MKIAQTLTCSAGNRYLLGKGIFHFACHSHLSCFTRCCHDADMYLYPYDIVRMKQRLGITSEEFLIEHAATAIRDMPAFPNVMLRMSDRAGKPCTFLNAQGCTIYEDRPYSCRAYPLEPAMYGDERGNVRMHCYVMRHGHCMGHKEDRGWTADAWMADQQMSEYNESNSRWARIAARFQSNPFGSGGVDSPPMKMAFMASYNMDTFRRFVFESSFLSRYEVSPEQREAVKCSDNELLMLGLAWIERFLFGDGPLLEKV
jgi:uncharacterized protein